jgi:ATP-binding cassette, subfamily B, bacterial
MAERKYSDRALMRRLLLQVRPYWLHIAGILGVSLLATPLALLGPVPMKIVVDNVLGGKPLPESVQAMLPAGATSSSAMLAMAIGLLLLVTLLEQLQGLANSLLRSYTGEKMVLNFRAQLFRHVQRLSLVYHDSKGTADAAYRIVWDTEAVRWVAVDTVPSLVTAAFTLVAMVYVVFRIDWQLALVALAISPFLFILARAYRTRLRSQSRETKKLESSALAVIQEVLASLRVVKAFGQEDREQERFVDRSAQGMQARIRYTLTEGGLGLLLGMTTALGTAAVLWIGVQNIEAGTLTLGSLLLVMGYLSALYGPLNTLSRSITGLQSSLASAERAYALLDQEPDVYDRPGARPLDRARGAVTFHDVSFAYNKVQEVLRDITFEVPAGARVGVAGRTGAGKTTLVNLLTRFYDPSAGEIALDGIDLREYRLADLRNQFAIVLQEPVLFSTSICENIAYARPGASEQEVIEAAKAANAHEFIAALPGGYDMQVGERGMSLSGGERQRIALARAFLKDAPILILDEPTSSVDMKTETMIIEAMERLMRDRTTFMIAHRLTTLESCDLLLVIEDGRLVDVRSDVSTAVRHAVEQGGLEMSLGGIKVDG